ncbi:biogenesis of lysosome-related organelles complex 1 subunit 6-like [Glandiceps talaboti]
MATAGTEVETSAPQDKPSDSTNSDVAIETKDGKKEETDLEGGESSGNGLPEATIEIGDDAVATISLQELESMINYNPEANAKLTEGMLSCFVPQMNSTKQLLSELTRHQAILLETLQQENAKFNECHAMKELIDLFAEAKRYHQKLIGIRKEMVHLHDKTAKLKKRALKLQNEKMKENLKKEQQKERELEQERQLMARPTKELQEKTSEQNANS